MKARINLQLIEEQLIVLNEGRPEPLSAEDELRVRAALGGLTGGCNAAWYAERVAHYEAEGLCTSDAQGCADADQMAGRLDAPQPTNPLRGCNIEISVDGFNYRMSRDGLERWDTGLSKPRWQPVDTDGHDRIAAAVFHYLEEMGCKP